MFVSCCWLWRGGDSDLLRGRRNDLVSKIDMQAQPFPKNFLFSSNTTTGEMTAYPGWTPDENACRLVCSVRFSPFGRKLALRLEPAEIKRDLETVGNWWAEHGLEGSQFTSHVPKGKGGDGDR